MPVGSVTFSKQSFPKKIIHCEIGSFLKTTALVLCKTCLIFVGMIALRQHYNFSLLNFLIFPFSPFVSYLYSRMWDNIITHLNIQYIF